MKRLNYSHLMLAALVLMLALALVGCDADTPQNTFRPDGDVAADQRDLFNLALWPSIVVFILVEAILVFALIRFRHKPGEPLPQQVHGNTGLEIAWTIPPAVLLLGLTIPMVAMIVDLGGAPAADALHVKVTGFQWNWQFEYTGEEFQDAEGNPLRIIGQCPSNCAQLHIPEDRQIAVELHSADVVHSFWVPRLAGKLDAIPGNTNRFWFNATKPGSYSGQCAEFCGLSHAEMRLTVVAETQAEFQQWAKEQMAPPTPTPAATGAGGVKDGE